MMNSNSRIGIVVVIGAGLACVVAVRLWTLQTRDWVDVGRCECAEERTIQFVASNKPEMGNRAVSWSVFDKNKETSRGLLGVLDAEVPLKSIRLECLQIGADQTVIVDTGHSVILDVMFMHPTNPKIRDADPETRAVATETVRKKFGDGYVWSDDPVLREGKRGWRP